MHWNQGAVGKSHVALSQGSETALRAVPDMAPRERGARRSEVEVEEASVSSWENSIHTTVKEELFAVSPEVSMQFRLAHRVIRPEFDKLRALFCT